VARAAGLGAAQIVPLIDVVAAEGNMVLVSPFVSGTDLGRIIKERRVRRRGGETQGAHPLSLLADREYLATMLAVLDQVIESVAAVHEAGECYPELKPANVLVDENGQVGLTDFGLSRLASRFTAEDGGQPESHLGIAGYISPEEWQGRRRLGPEADVFRLGVLIYQALTLELPYGIAPIGPGRSPPKRPGARQELLGAALDGVILKALEAERSKRHENAKALAAEWRQSRGAATSDLANLGSFLQRVRQLGRW
jgi:serine/threonine protein kinase